MAFFLNLLCETRNFVGRNYFLKVNFERIYIRVYQHFYLNFSIKKLRYFLLEYFIDVLYQKADVRSDTGLPQDSINYINEITLIGCIIIFECMILIKFPTIFFFLVIYYCIKRSVIQLKAMINCNYFYKINKLANSFIR